ncbi:MAG TPA: glycoside hydrolase family 9 protein [Candidatus Aminicenantes bacterium]|nr:glycoside hydrolase family 9 protein [Candidatus Aminicenantes bacterium]
MTLLKRLGALLCLLPGIGLSAADAPLVLTNHLGYEREAVKRAVIRSHAGDAYDRFEVRAWPGDAVVFEGAIGPGTPVDKWKDWVFWGLDFTGLRTEGDYTLHCYGGGRVIRSLPFKVQRLILERNTLSNAIAWFKTQRSSGFLDKADRNVPFRDSDRRMDAHGGWYDATGDYGKHFTQLSGTSYFNTQQIPLVAYSLFRALDILTERGDVNFAQMRRRLLDEALYGADYLVRFRDPKASFYQSVMGMGPGKKPEDRRVGNYESKAGDRQSYRAGAGLAIAALAMAARQPEGLEHEPAAYLKAARDVFDYLEAHNAELTNDKKENMVDDYCALTAAAELHKTTKDPAHLAAAVKRAESLLARLTPQGYWRVDDKDRPFFSPSDAGLPVVSLLDFHGVAPAPMRKRILEAVRKSLAYELRVTAEAANPFGYARQLVQHRDGRRNTAFFFPHDTEAAPWWQGENARLASLACAARLAAPFFPEDGDFQARLRAYALDQLNWILGLNPYDACMLGGTGRNNPEYIFLGTWQYENVPGGVVNGITSGMTDEHDIDYNVGYETTGVDHDWRWMEQWLPHTAWYMLAVAAGDRPAAAGEGPAPER